MTFQDFRNGPGADIARRLFNIDIANMSSWTEFRSAVSAASNRPGFLERIETEISRMSSSEKALAAAMLYVVDYAAQANDVGGNFLALFAQCSGAHRTAALAALAAIGRAGG